MRPSTEKRARRVDQPADSVLVGDERLGGRQILLHVLYGALQHEQFVAQVLKLGTRDDQLGLIQAVRLGSLTRLKVALTAA